MAVARSPQGLVVIGASAGGVEVLRRLVSALPLDLPATVCVVLHLAPGSPSALAKILERAGPLPCHAAVDGEPLEPGTILVAPPDRHLIVEDGHVRLTTGPRENGHRPAVDTLFRSAAAALDGQVVGVVLSGARDDGSAGLATIKSAGGAAVVQDPAEATYAGMPASALKSTAVDVVAPADRIAEAIVRLLRSHDDPLRPHPELADPAPSAGGEEMTTICPECGGVLAADDQAGVPQWACRVGHRYSAESLLTASAAETEAILWAAIRAFEDRRVLLALVADRRQADGDTAVAEILRERAGACTEQAYQVRATLTEAAQSSLRTISDPVLEAHEVK